ncbi:o-succinylbenzoate--CoA ligase [Aquibacillus koreensis]|uniref:2-succinylbenzoate--CoA ligase n=1 Tax=Aquibacillus koreensis TaxID=279446 RepID=A0A9X3WN51_9BACI|nr:o-succinylbenzoate--CoA ligase [Aquibacillus koreensis]MCT2535848.1 o-succinylbenzoate--CoA ligase [Aquibacillus koreensis]MDC3420304.1 o-succinylbenzoate--CoA ligase [Aquibacillus koreensis]
MEIMQHWLDKRAALSPDDTAIEHPMNGSITFKQLRDQAQSFSRKVAQLGVMPGDAIAIYSNNSIDMVTAIHGLSYIGAVVVLLNTRLSNQEIVYQLTDSNVSFVLTGDDLYENGVEIAQSRQCEVQSFEQVSRLDEKQLSLKKEIALEDTYTIIYTSGTTGFPKGVQHTFGNHWWSAISSALNLGLDPRDKWLASLPLFHVGGFSILMKSVIYGMPVYLLDHFDADKVHQGIVENGVTIVSVVSVMLDRLIDRLGEQTYPEAFKCMLLGGGPAPKVLLEKAKACLVPVYQTYGMTETSSQIVTLSPSDALRKLGSAGKPLFPAQLKIVNQDSVITNDEIGEIFVKGPMVTPGYYQNDEANSKSFHNGWLATGDLGYLDNEGFLYVVDRRKDLIISGGENIYPAEIENVLLGMSGIVEAGVVGKDDEKWGQVPVAFVVKNENSLHESAVIAYCLEKLAKYKTPKHIYFLDALPRNASNKLVRHKLVDLLYKEEE